MRSFRVRVLSNDCFWLTKGPRSWWNIRVWAFNNFSGGYVFPKIQKCVQHRWYWKISSRFFQFSNSCHIWFTFLCSECWNSIFFITLFSCVFFSCGVVWSANPNEIGSFLFVSGILFHDRFILKAFFLCGCQNCGLTGLSINWKKRTKT